MNAPGPYLAHAAYADAARAATADVERARQAGLAAQVRLELALVAQRKASDSPLTGDALLAWVSHPWGTVTTPPTEGAPS